MQVSEDVPEAHCYATLIFPDLVLSTFFVEREGFKPVFYN